MTGETKRMIDLIIEKRSNGYEVLKNTTRTKLIIKGFNPDRWTSQSEDDPAKIAELKQIARDMGIELLTFRRSGSPPTVKSTSGTSTRPRRCCSSNNVSLKLCCYPVCSLRMAQPGKDRIRAIPAPDRPIPKVKKVW